MGVIRHAIYLTLGVVSTLCTLSACQKTDEQRSILPSGIRLCPGDLVFRRGMGVTSRIVLTADREGRYSHVGMVVDSCGVPMVIHAVPGEPDYDGDVDRVKMDTPERFFSTMHAAIGEVRRPSDSLRAAKAAEVVWQIYRRGTLFDHDYDDEDSTRMYCTELVVYALRRAGYDVSMVRHHELNLPVLNASAMFPSDICVLPCLEPIAEF